MATKAIKRTSSHSVRTSDELWGAAKRRADSEGVTMNHVITEILEGYSHGLINMPKVIKQYQAPAPPGGTAVRE